MANGYAGIPWWLWAVIAFLLFASGCTPSELSVTTYHEWGDSQDYGEETTTGVAVTLTLDLEP